MATSSCYALMKNTNEGTNSHVISMTSSVFPSHIRSIQPIHDGNESNVKWTEKPALSYKQVYVILVLIFIVSTSAVVGLTLFEVRRILRSGELKKASFLTANNGSRSSGFHREVTGAVGAELGYDAKDRVPCVQECETYVDKKFNSSCDLGYCACNGSNYQTLTCLPKTKTCIITKSKNNRTSRAYMFKDEVPVYTCAPRDQTGVIVFGIYGNHFSEVTTVNLTRGQRAITLVLASHYPVRWRILEHDNTLIAVHVISSLSVPRREAVFLEKDFKSRNKVPPKIHISQDTVGYGDDRGQSNTVTMMHTIDHSIGQVERFIGAKYANFISMQIDS